MGEQRQGIMGDSNFLCSEYDDRVDLARNETDSWERDHSCNTGKANANGKYEGGVTKLVVSEGSKEDSSQTMNKGHPFGGSCQTII